MPYLLLMVVRFSLIRSPDKIQRLENYKLDRSLQTASTPCDIVIFLIYTRPKILGKFCSGTYLRGIFFFIVRFLDVEVTHS